MKLSKLITLLQDIAQTHGDLAMKSCQSSGFVERITGVQIIGEEDGDVLFLKSRPSTKCTMTDKQKLAAKMSLMCAYLEKFNDQPDKPTEMLMDLESTLARVHAGEKFRWEQDGSNWRVLRWGGQNT